MSEFRGDFLGFTFNGKHSSELGIVRTSDGSRFNENLLPTIQDKTVQVPGGDGMYYFGSYYTQRQFSIPFAFDSLTDSQVRELRTHFGDKQIHDLVFDETPYKTYRAKVTGTAQIKYVAFDEEGKEECIYKGEGTIQFTCYDPYAICKTKLLDGYTSSNKSEWAARSGLASSGSGYDSFSDGAATLYNPGDLEANFLLKISLSASSSGIKITQKTNTVGQLNWSPFAAKTGDSYVIVNSKLNIIEGYDENNIKTGNIYNEHITDGAFFAIPKGESTLTLINYSSGGYDDPSIEYNYYYI